MKAIYRLCGIPSTNPSPIYQENKDKLNELCLKSFVRAFRDIRPDMHFLCDFCPDSYREMISLTIPKSWNVEIEFTRIGINNTAIRSYDIARKADDTVYFAECDYIYREDSGIDLLRGIEHFGLASPYDHLNFYIDKSIHSENVTIRLVDGVHWRTTERNTMTFGMTKEAFTSGYDIFRKYGYLDSDVWHENRAIGNQLWVPIPSLATHMAKDWLAPGINWESIWKNII